MDGNTSAPSFQGLGWRRGYTESETKENWAAESRMGNADDEYEFGWIPPREKPSPLVIATPFEKPFARRRR